MISKELLSELSQIFKEEFGINLNETQTKEIALFLVTWFEMSQVALKDW